jgi:hypothetical protein
MSQLLLFPVQNRLNFDHEDMKESKQSLETICNQICWKLVTETSTFKTGHIIHHLNVLKLSFDMKEVNDVRSWSGRLRVMAIERSVAHFETETLVHNFLVALCRLHCGAQSRRV